MKNPSLVPTLALSKLCFFFFCWVGCVGVGVCGKLCMCVMGMWAGSFVVCVYGVLAMSIAGVEDAAI